MSFFLVDCSGLGCPFDQKFREFGVRNRMEQKFSGIKFRNFGYTSRGCPSVLENRKKKNWLFPSRGGRATRREKPWERGCVTPVYVENS